ncbi:MAG TPA: DinB family protein [Tepidisphaeraceae bacterium]|jgi:hypothetical protein|nr:DinB family protein [Tepidisphaeraceae bacterium]
MTTKELLLKQTADAFDGRPDMSLMAALKDITQAEGSWRADASMPTAEQLVRHIAWAKSWYCHEGFGTPMVLVDDAVNESGDHAELPWEFPCGAAYGLTMATGIGGAIGLLRRAHAVFIQCLESCTDEQLDRPIPTHHGKKFAANLFAVMLIHDAYHAGQIRTRRTMWRTAGGGSA